MKTWFACTYLAIASLQASAALEPFRSHRAPSETISHYEVHVPVVLHSEATSSDEHVESLDLQISSYIIHLELNRGLVHPSFTSHSFDELGNLVVDKGHVNCFYHGWVENHPNWHVVSISTCNGVHGSFGELGSRGHYYHVEPLDAYNSAIEQPHALYSSTELSPKLETCGVDTDQSTMHAVDSMAVPDHGILSNKDRVRRQVDGFYIVEWALVNDMAQYNALGGNLTATVLRDLEIANLVDSLYRDLSVRVVLVHTLTWTAGDMISFPSDHNANDILVEFKAYHPQITPQHDSAMLITGVDLLGSTVGIGSVGTMCRGQNSVGVTQDGGRTVQSVASTAAHELGHIFSMSHDEETCTCTDPSDSCIMSAVAQGSPAPTEWSSCSRTALSDGFMRLGLGSCLDNQPVMTVGGPTCGNGIRENEEVCDCGSPEECRDPCCNATACLLVEGAECSSTESCCTADCRLASSSHPCRPTSQECDVTEYCSGNSSECPEDVYKQDASLCDSGRHFCFGGECQTRDKQCQRFFGTNGSSLECYESNTRGDQFGNCGSSQGAYVSCPVEDVTCGQLQCQKGTLMSPGVGGKATIVTVEVRGELCQAFTNSPGDDFISPGLVADGTRCREGSLCYSQSCVALSELDYIKSCPRGTNGEICSGTGVCNTLNQCSCDTGWTGSLCELEVEDECLALEITCPEGSQCVHGQSEKGPTCSPADSTSTAPKLPGLLTSKNHAALTIALVVTSGLLLAFCVIAGLAATVNRVRRRRRKRVGHRPVSYTPRLTMNSYADDNEHVQLCQHDMSEASLEVSDSYDYVQDAPRYSGEGTTAGNLRSGQASGDCGEQGDTGPAGRIIPLLPNVAYRRGPGGGVIQTSHNAAYGVGVKEDHGTSDPPSSADLHTDEVQAGRPGGHEVLSSGTGAVPSGGVRNSETEIATARDRDGVYDGPQVVVRYDEDEMEHTYQNVHFERPP